MSANQPESGAKRRFGLQRRDIVITLVLLLTVGVVVLIIPVVRISLAVPGSFPDGPAKLGELIERFQPSDAGPDAPDAYDLLLQALERSVALDEEIRDLMEQEMASRFPDPGEAAYLDMESIEDPTIPHINTRDLSADEAKNLQREYNKLFSAYAMEYLDALRESGVYDLLDQMAVAPRAVPDVGTAHPMAVRMLDSLGHSRALARALKAQFLLSVRRGDPIAAARAHEHVLAIARTLSYDPTLISRLVVYALLALADGMVQDAFASESLDADTIRALLNNEQRRRSLAPHAMMLEGERLLTLDTIAITHSDDGAGSGYALPTEMSLLTGSAFAANAPSPRNIPGLGLPRKRATVQLANEYFDACVARASLAPRDRVDDADWKRLLERIDDSKLLSAILSTIGTAQQFDDAATCRSAGMRLRLAIELYRARHAEPPPSLDALLPTYLDAIPQDPFAHDASFIYRPLPEPDEHGRVYLLYSVGADGQDDACAELPSNTRHQALMPGHAGADYAFTPASPDEAP
ncbi:MAG: hypothetical protein R3B57_08225 [Phycisphaerales bacterium]